MRYNDRDLRLATHFHLLPSFRIEEAKISLHLYVFIACIRKTYHLSLPFTGTDYLIDH